MRSTLLSTSGAPDLLDDDFAVLVDGAVVDHAHYGHAQVTANTEGDAEAQAAQDGDDVAAGQTEAVALAQRGLLLRGLPGPPVLRQLDHLPGFLLLLHHPATTRWRHTLKRANSKRDLGMIHAANILTIDHKMGKKAFTRPIFVCCVSFFRIGLVLFCFVFCKKESLLFTSRF